MTTNNEQDYTDWWETAWNAGLDWDNPANLPPAEMLDEEMLLAALQDAPDHIAKIPRDLLTPAFYEKAASYDWQIAKHLPDELKSEEVYRAALVSSHYDEQVSDLFPRNTK